MINQIFYWCVEFLKIWSKNFGMTYEELNVWLFVVIHPALTLILLFTTLRLWRKLRRLKG